MHDNYNTSRLLSRPHPISDQIVRIPIISFFHHSYFFILNCHKLYTKGSRDPSRVCFIEISGLFNVQGIFPLYILILVAFCLVYLHYWKYKYTVDIAEEARTYIILLTIISNEK